MADFRQLALEFVLEDDETKLASLAQKTARELQAAPSNTLPVARWVEAVQPWMPGNKDDTADDQDTPDWTSRAKALEFLSRTLDFVNKEFLKPSHVKLLVNFFGAMFDVDHKAGILASASALSRIIAMKAFQPQSGYDIIQKVCTLKDDFQRQVSKTRLTVYELLRSLITTPEVASDLQYRDGAASGFMTDLLQLCRSERDPDCLIVWFDTLRAFLQQEYSPSEEVVEEVYGTFKSYYPITLPRTSQSGITPDQLKNQLRKCFSSNHRLAPLALPFLIGKLDQGDGVTVNVKIDVLETIKACLEEYTHTEQSVIPYVNRIWGSLKYEVRNGEIEDTIWATLEVLKTLATKLKDDNLRDYTLNVTRDCVNDLSNPMYTASAGRLLVSVLSANPSAFVLMVAPTITHIKENLRHPKSPTHTQALLKILYVILETRILLVDAKMTDQEKSDFAAVDSIFKTLYSDVYKAPVNLGCKEDATYDEIKTSTEAVQGAGALASQQLAKSLDPKQEDVETGLLLPDGTCLQISQDLFAIVLQAFSGDSRNPNSDDLLNETAKALQRAVRAYTPGFKPLLDQFVAVIQGSRDPRQYIHSAETIQRLGPLLAYVGCSELPRSLAGGIKNFLSLIHMLTTELVSAMDAKTDPKVWCALAAGIQSVVRYFNDACLKHDLVQDQAVDGSSWLRTIVDKYPELRSIDSLGNDDNTLGESKSNPKLETSATELRNDFLLISFFVVRHLYRRATTPVHAHPGTGRPALRLSDDFTGSNKASESQYLHLLSDFASFVVHEMSESQQLSLTIDECVLDLFQNDSINIPIAKSEEQKTEGTESSGMGNGPLWSWLIQERVNILVFGLLEALRPAGVARLFNNGVAQELLISDALATSDTEDSVTKPVARSILTILANKYKIETLDQLMTALEQQLATTLKRAKASSDGEDAARNLQQASSVYAIASGLLRRYSGKQAQGLLQILREAPNDSAIGQHLARRLEMVVAPQRFLTKGNFAVTKPLWMQRVYMEIAKPMLQIAVGSDLEVQDPLIKMNFSIGVLLMVKHMPFSIYEDDCGQILRVSIVVAQNLGVGSDTMAALEVLKNILAESSDKAQDHLRSLVNISISSFSSKATQQNRPEWLPSGYAPKSNPDVEAGCGKLALEILGALPRMFESRHLLSFAPRVGRELSLACGHPVRDLRRIARMARKAWSEVD